MNYSGSYKRLLENSKAALVAAIEIYNKPAFSYREECAVILLLNSWELLLKAILSKNRKSIYYPKKRKEPYRTLSWQDAYRRASAFFPASFGSLAMQRNIELIGTYRDNAVHFYNTRDFGLVVHALAQTSIKNFRDLLNDVFGQRLEDEINWRLMPLGIEPPIDVIAYMAGTGVARPRTSAVRQFLSELAEARREVIAEGQDSGRLMTVFNVGLESKKKIGDVDVTVGLDSTPDGEGPLVVTRRQDPNLSHPLRRKEICTMLPPLHDTLSNAFVFDAIVWKYDIKGNPQFCWEADEGYLIKYSHDLVTFIKKLSTVEVQGAIESYRKHQAARRQATKAT